MTSTCKWLLGIVLLIFFTSMGGLYQYLKDANIQQIENLRSELDLLTRENLQIRAELNKSVINYEKSFQNEENLEDLNQKELQERISRVEKERDALIEQALSQTMISLDPRSEIAAHIELLNSTSIADQTSAIDFLFAIKDPVTYRPLIEYFKKTDSGTDPYVRTIFDWYKLFLEVDQKAGIEFIISELSNSNSNNSNSAFKVLKDIIEDSFMHEKIEPGLNNVALTSNNSTARGYAKILLDIIKGNRLD